MNELILLPAVALIGTSQLLQKLVAAGRLRQARTLGQWWRALVCRELLLAVVAIAAGTALWLWALYTMDLSRAFPMLSLSTVMVVSASHLIFLEPVSRFRWAGIAFIALGLVLVNIS